MSVVQLPGTEKAPSWSDMIEKMVSELPAQLKYIEVRAKMARHAYKTLVEEGFSHEEALDMCTKLY